MSLDWPYNSGDSPDDAQIGNNVDQDAMWQPHQDLLYEETNAADGGVQGGKVARPHVDQLQLLCRTGCGFYGIPAWQGHCSKCYKELHAKSARSRQATRISRPVFDPTNIKNKVSRSVSDVSYLPGKASQLINMKIDKLEKRRQQISKHKNNNIVKSFFGKTSFNKGSSSGVPIPLSVSHGASANQELEAFLQTLSKDGGGAVRKQLSVFVDKLHRTVHTQSLEDTADQLQDLYTTIHNMVSTHQAFAGMTGWQVIKVTDLTERYVTTRLHAQLTSVVNARCEEQDLAIQNRIRSLSWISADMLECKLDDNEEDMAGAIDAIIGELIELDSLAVPIEKLLLLVSCCHQIMGFLTERCSSAASADDFLPALIYCVLRANPPLLHSNIAYLTSFAQQRHLQSGEAGYFFTNLCCAVAFIEKLCGESLGLTEVEFEWHMSGLALPRHPKAAGPVTALANSIHRHERELATLDSLSRSYDETLQQINDLHKQISEQFRASVTAHPLHIESTYSRAAFRGLLQGCTDVQPDIQAVTTGHCQVLLQKQDDLNQSSKIGGDKLDTTSRECEEAFNLYYSLEDFITPSSPEKDVAQPAPQAVAPDVTRSTLIGGSLLDDPVPHDKTVALLEQSSAGGGGSTNDTSKLSLLDEPVSPLTSTTAPSLLPLLPQYSGFRIQSNQIPSIPCGTGPSSIPSHSSTRSNFDGTLLSDNNQNSSAALHNIQEIAAESKSFIDSDNFQPDLVKTTTKTTNLTNSSVDDLFSLPQQSTSTEYNKPLPFVINNDTNELTSANVLMYSPPSTSLPQPLQPVISSATVPTSSGPPSQGNVASQPMVAARSKGAASTPAQTDKRDALETVVDVLVGIADSIDQLI